MTIYFDICRDDDDMIRLYAEEPKPELGANEDE